MKSNSKFEARSRTFSAMPYFTRGLKSKRTGVSDLVTGVLQLFRDLLTDQLILEHSSPPAVKPVSLTSQHAVLSDGVQNLNGNRQLPILSPQLTLNFRLEEPQLRTRTFSRAGPELRARPKNGLMVLEAKFWIMTALNLLEVSIS